MQFPGIKALRGAAAATAAATVFTLAACGGGASTPATTTPQSPAASASVSTAPTTQAVAAAPTPSGTTPTPTPSTTPSGMGSVQQVWTTGQRADLVTAYAGNPAFVAHNVPVACLLASLVNETDPTSTIAYIKAWSGPGPTPSDPATALLAQAVANCTNH
jgi:hypothetical protein